MVFSERTDTTLNWNELDVDENRKEKYIGRWISHRSLNFQSSIMDNVQFNQSV